MTRVKNPLTLALLVGVVTVAVFAPLIACEFTSWDDPETLVENPRLHPPTWSNVGYYWTASGPDAPMGLYVPVTYTAWSGIAAITGGVKPAPFHAANVLLHAVNVVLVFQLLRRLI